MGSGTGNGASKAAALVGNVLEGKYEILRVIGEGGMGVVYEASHKLLGHRLAVKVLHPDVARDPGIIERFHNEARIAAALGHENIVKVTDMGVLPSGAPFLVMEYLEGESLASRIESGGPLPPRQAAEIVVHVLHALSLVHHAGVVHRDLKPDNVFLAQRPAGPGREKTTVKLLDFGVSKLRTPGAQHLHLTRTGAVLGTPYYMAPEQAAGKKDMDHRADIYSVGVILYETLTGRRPFEGQTCNELFAAILMGPPTPPRRHRPGLPAKIETVVMKAISRKPEERFATAAEFLRALEPFAPPALASSLDRSRSGAAAVQTAVGTPAVTGTPSGIMACAAG
ncbi:MAG: serine/threonine-protein kinase, partial [Myxococcota bacterium]|nr:serine/threonine-protein kinase [Myxococcota bacterium]